MAAPVAWVASVSDLLCHHKRISHLYMDGDMCKGIRKTRRTAYTRFDKVFGHTAPYGVSTSMSEKGVKCWRL